MQNRTLPKLTSTASIISLLTLILFCASAIAHGPVKKSTKSRFYTEFEYEYIADKIIIPVEIDNNTYRFVFDTDVPSVISDRVLKKINIEDKKNIELKTGNNANISLDLVTLPTIQIGGVAFKSTTSLVDHKVIGSLISCLNVDGSIGSSLFANSIVQILPRRKLIRLTSNKKKLPLEKQDAMKLFLLGTQAQPYFEIEVHGNETVEDKVLFDTGMAGLYNLSKNKLLEFEQNNSVKKNNMNSPLIAKISIAQATFKNIPVIISNTVNSRIGIDLLKHGNVTLNFKNKKMYFDPFDQEIDLANKAEDIYLDGVKATSPCM